ncbi:hypothetical protein PoB_002068300 [Plakobranchus ocellatus]|uniref:Uncharacterized protein n=1 Tax=Plakobranchus ocellatus TaxID=259542 RepID=A0AAV3ZI78_9GAST|nr:hypothetical protein PoB_002068300 [Plakobranchus ocellatus]
MFSVQDSSRGPKARGLVLVEIGKDGNSTVHKALTPRGLLRVRTGHKGTAQPRGPHGDRCCTCKLKPTASPAIKKPPAARGLVRDEAATDYK